MTTHLLYHARRPIGNWLYRNNFEVKKLHLTQLLRQSRILCTIATRPAVYTRRRNNEFYINLYTDSCSIKFIFSSSTNGASVFGDRESHVWYHSHTVCHESFPTARNLSLDSFKQKLQTQPSFWAITNIMRRLWREAFRWFWRRVTNMWTLLLIYLPSLYRWTQVRGSRCWSRCQELATVTTLASSLAAVQTFKVNSLCRYWNRCLTSASRHAKNFRLMRTL